MSGRGIWAVPWASNPEKRFRLSPSAPKLSAGVAYWWCIGSPVRSTEFDSPHPLHAGVAQVEEHRTRNAEVGVSNPPSGSSGKKLSRKATLSADKLGLY